MNLRLDRCGWPVVEFRPHRYVHLYPLTIYHLERFAWETGSFTPEVAEILGDRARPGAWRAHPADGHLLIATGLCWRTGEEIASWLGGRLPGRGEWMGAALSWKERPASALAGAIASGGSATGDPRACALATTLLASATPRERVLPQGYGDMVFEFSEPPLGDRWVLRPSGSVTRIDADAGATVVLAGAGLSVVFEERDVVPLPPGAASSERGRLWPTKA